MKMSVRKQRITAVAVFVALLASLMLGSAAGLAVTEQEMLFNGSFEFGFWQAPGCGAVGNGWGCFTNGGSVAYGFYDDQWEPVKVDGENSQLIEMNTMQPAASEPDRYAGIYQTVNVVKGAIYQFKVNGLVREALKDGNKPDPKDDPYRYRVQWGYTTGSTEWTDVTNWLDIPWDRIDPRTEPHGLQEYGTSFDAPSDQVTIFVRLWKKWGTVYREVDFNLDGLSLWGPGVVDCPKQDGMIVLPTPGGKPPKEVPPVDKKPSIKVPPGDEHPDEVYGDECYGPNLVANGNFEAGFVKGVAKYWKSFNNGGKAGYGFYDEKWPLVIEDGAHAQLIEINSKGLALADGDRVAGIYQVVKGLVPGQTYQFSVWGQMREEQAHPDEDAYRYRVRWGFAPAGGKNNASSISNWSELTWDKINLRTAPGDMQFYSEEFVAPSRSIVLAIEGLKKWGTPYRELDVDLDVVQVQPRVCGSDDHGVEIVPPHDGGMKVVPPSEGGDQGGQPPEGGDQGGPPSEGGKQGGPPPEGGKHAGPPPAKDEPACSAWYTVKKGDTLGAIAARYHVPLAAIVAGNGIKNANLIYAGQPLCIPPN